MLDVHPPTHAAHTWRDFLIHIATICVGLLIAIGLEQTVELIHHHHQREDLEQQMRVESQDNVKNVQVQIDFGNQLLQYMTACVQALKTAPQQAGEYAVTLPPDQVNLPVDANGMLISPSRGTWTVATTSGTVALLPAETAKLYARLDLTEALEQQAERDSGRDANYLASARLRDNAPEESTSLRLTAAQRDDLLFAFTQMRMDTSIFVFRLAIVQGALQAILANVHSLDEMYRYQGRAIRNANAYAPLPIQSPPKSPAP